MRIGTAQRPSRRFDCESTLGEGDALTDDFDERFALYEGINLAIAAQAPVWYSGGTATAIVTDPSMIGIDAWHLPDGTLGVGHPNAEGRWVEVSLS